MENKKTIILLSLFFLLVIPIAIADTPLFGTFKKNTSINLIQTCSNCTFNNITSILYPNGSVMLSNLSMTKDGTNYNYTIHYNFSQTSGRYLVNGFGDLDGVNTVWVYDYEINPQGIPQSQERTRAVSNAVYFLFFIGVLLFIGFLFVKESVPIKWTFFLISMMFFLQSLNFLFINLQDEVINPAIESYFSFLTSAAFYLFWFMFGLLSIMWILTILQTLFFKQSMKNAEKYA